MMSKPGNSGAMNALMGALIIAVLLGATALRFHLLEAQSFWNDEGLSYINALRSIPEITHIVTYHDVHPPGYYYALAGWRLFAGTTEFALRAFSALLSVIGIAFAYALGKRLYHPIAGLAAAALVTFNTFSIFYAQEARMYAMLATVSAAGMWAYVGLMRAFNTGDAARRGAKLRRYGLALGVFNVIGLYTHYTYPLIMIVQGLLFAGRLAAIWWRHGFPPLRRPLGVYVLINILTILPFTPWIGPGLAQLTSQPGLSEPVSVGLLLRVAQGWYAFGMTFEETMGNMGVAVYLLLLLGLLPLPGNRAGIWALLLPVVWVLVVTGVFVMADLYLRYLRFLLPAQIAFALWAGRGVWVLWSLRSRMSAAALQYLPKLAAVVVTGMLLARMAGGSAILYRDSQYQRDDYRSIVATIQAQLDGDDAIILNSPGQAVTFDYYYEGDAPVYPLPSSPLAEAIRAETLRIIQEHDRIFAVFWGNQEQDPEGIVERALNTHAFQIRDEWFGSARLAQYAAPAEPMDERSSEARFGDAILLREYALNGARFAPGDILRLRLSWMTEARLERRYKVFVQLLNSAGALVAQRDSEPGGGLLLTTGWDTGATIIDHHALPIPDQLPRGEYALIIGLYELDNPSSRLPVGDGDYWTVSVLTVE